VIRAARAADVDVVAALEKTLFGVDAWSPDLVAEELLGARRQAVIADAADGQVVGYAVLLLGGDVVDLQRIGVAPAYQRRGLAGALLADVRDRALGVGALRMMLEVSAANEPALAFYADAGFVEVDRRRRYYRDGTDAVVMKASLIDG
jgi:ribosomal-protein-alanine acetyltransferase